VAAYQNGSFMTFCTAFVLKDFVSSEFYENSLKSSQVVFTNKS